MSWTGEVEVDLVVVGSGVAGLTAALGAAEQDRARRVLVVTKGALGDSGSSPWAQGGVAAAVGLDDSPELHAADTERVGRGLNDPSAVRQLTSRGPSEIARLVEWGARFDRHEPTELSGDRIVPSGEEPASDLVLGQEAGHRRRRILHAGGDRTGAEIMRVLRQQVLDHPRIQVVEDFFAADLLLSEASISETSGADRGSRRVIGLWGYSTSTAKTLTVLSPATVLATGGLGRLYRFTTNPPEVTGDGIAMAARAGARMADLEFVQFHPTALDVTALSTTRDTDEVEPRQLEAGEALPLLTEALRGDGALLVDAEGRRFMVDVHPDAELAPRDIVARTLFQRGLSGESSWLDVRPVIAGDLERFEQRFPNAASNCRRFGIDPTSQPVPVTPAAHYTMGGVLVDASGRTSLEGLWSCGETTSSGVHGANRLASNSLLEGLVFGRRVVEAIDPSTRPELPRNRVPALPQPPAKLDSRRGRQVLEQLRAAMWSHAGLVRDEQGLQAALVELDRLEHRLAAERPGARVPSELGNLLLCGRMVATAALLRTESRGAHHRSDYPRASAAWRRRSSFVLKDLLGMGSTSGEQSREKHELPRIVGHDLAISPAEGTRLSGQASGG